MHQPSISVIIPTFNCSRYIEDAVESVLSQTCRPFEVIVCRRWIDDDTSSRLRKYGDRLQVVTQENQGSSKARNVGLERCRGDYVAFLDADDLWRPAKLEWQIACFRELATSGWYSPIFPRSARMEKSSPRITSKALSGLPGVRYHAPGNIPGCAPDSRDGSGLRTCRPSVLVSAQRFVDLCKGNFILPEHDALPPDPHREDRPPVQRNVPVRHRSGFPLAVRVAPSGCLP